MVKNASNIAFLFLITFIPCFNQSNLCYANTIHMDVSQDKVNINESFTVSFILNNTSNNGRPDFSPLTRDFQVLGTNYGTSVQMVNGDTQSSVFWQVTLAPKKVGTLWIPEIEFGNVKSEPRKITVVNNVVNTVNDGESFFVKAEVSNKSPYVKSELIYIFKLFYRNQLENPMIEPPTIEDMVFTPVGNDKRYQTNIKGEDYLVYEKHFALFPQKPGKVTLPPMYFRALQTDFGSNLFSGPFNMGSNKAINLATQALTLNVRDIPKVFVGSDWLPAKSLTISQEWSADIEHWEAGVPVTRTITIETEGQRADLIPDLNVAQIPGMNIYTETAHRTNRYRGDTVIGSWQQKITYIPNTAQTFHIPMVQLKWWNIDKHMSEVARLELIEVAIKNKVTSSAPALLSNHQTASSTTIHNDGLSTKVSAPAIPMLQTKKDKTWFWVALGLLFLWVLTLIWGWKNKRIRQQVAKKPVQNIVAHKNKFSKASLVQACQANDAVRAREVLLAWGSTQLKEQPKTLGSLNDFVTDPQLHHEIMLLERCLYGTKHEAWQGKNLLNAFENNNHDKKSLFFGFRKAPVIKNKEADPLPPLHPDSVNQNTP